MAIIANMKKTEKGFAGKLKTATLDLYLKLEKKEGEKKSENAPDFKVSIGGYEAGAGWLRTSENDNQYVSVQIDSPEFPEPLNANLVSKEDNHLLLWSRDK